MSLANKLSTRYLKNLSAYAGALKTNETINDIESQSDRIYQQIKDLLTFKTKFFKFIDLLKTYRNNLSYAKDF